MRQDLTGRTLGYYVIEEMLGSGGMGQVYRAVHQRLDRPAAVKVMHSHLAADPTFEARFGREARAAASLDHPNIIRVHEFGEQDGLIYLAMEYVPGGSLRSLLIERAHSRRALLPLGIDLARQVADGLHYAHSRGMIHRDIKPDNILIKSHEARGADGRRYTAVISDFGLARLREGGTLTVSGALLGTPAYMAPEQFQDKQLDGRSDIYALGVVLYEIATGYLPFEARTISDAAYKHVHTPPAPPRQVHPDVPDDLEAIILRCLAKDPDDRFDDAAALSSALRSTLRGLGSLEHSTHVPDWNPVTVDDPSPSPVPVDQDVGEDVEVDIDRDDESGPILPTGAGRIYLLFDDERLDLTPGEPAMIRVTLANLGTTVDHLRFEIEGVPDGWVQALPPEVQLNPGSNRQIDVRINVPRATASHAGDYHVTLRARSRANPEESSAANALWRVAAFRGTQFEMVSGGAGESDADDVIVALTNTGNTPERVSLSGADDRRAIRFRFDPEAFVVGPGERGTARVELSAPTRLVGGPTTHRFVIRAAIESNGEHEAHGQLSQPARVPFWAVPVIGIAALALCVAGFLLFRELSNSPPAQRTPAPGTIVVIPSSPSDLTLSLSLTAVTLSWQHDGLDVGHFEVQRSVNNQAFERVDVTRSLNFRDQFENIPAQPGRIAVLTYRVRAISPDGEASPFSNEEIIEAPVFPAN